MRFFLQIVYKGTHYHGWQIQPNAITIQGTIQAYLKKILQKPILLIGSGRTDKGVHAQQQWAHIDLEHMVDVNQLRYQINRVLPHDIVIQTICPVKAVAHARFAALARSYEYKIMSDKNPFLGETHYLLSNKLDLEAMNQSAATLCQETDFTSFSKVNLGLIYYRCSIMQAKWTALAGGRLMFYIQANRFLRGMVRSIVGNLIKVGLGKISSSDFKMLIYKKDRRLSASLAPACGLTLTEVTYPSHIFIT